MHGPLRFTRIIAHGLWALGKIRDLLFSELINFMDKIILEKSRIIKPRKILRKLWKFKENSQRHYGTWWTQIKYLELIKILLGTWNIKIKVKEAGIKFQKEAGKFLEIDILLLNVFFKHIFHIETQGATSMNATNTFLPYDKF